MIIKTVAIGNQVEAFIEERFENRVNVIFSDDNNKGKTILMQSIVYSIGYESIWPVGFNPNKYFFYTKILFGDEFFEFLRHKNSIQVFGKEKYFHFNSISEFRYFFSKEIAILPKIPKDGQQKTCDLSLFYELFFLGQDKRNTSNTIVRNNHNKADFLNMIFSLQNIPSDGQLDIQSNIEELKRQKEALENQIKVERKKIKILKTNPQIATYVSDLANNEDHEKVRSKLEELHNSVSDLRKQRNREENRKVKLSYLLQELNSLNRNLDLGKVRCADCQSSNIVFINKDMEFNVSNKNIRDTITSSIKDNIKLKEEIIDELDDLIIKEQTEIKKIFNRPEPDFDLASYALFQQEIKSTSEIDDYISELRIELNGIINAIKTVDNNIESNKEKQQLLLNQITSEITRLYKIIDPQGTMSINNLFTKSNETFSGSEEQEFYFCKIVALNNILKHCYPIIIDSFREGELSTTKEEKMLDEFTKLNKQVILTSTLKREEYSSDKYKVFEKINSLDYSQFQDSKLLQTSYVENFKEILNNFPIKLN